MVINVKNPRYGWSLKYNKTYKLDFTHSKMLQIIKNNTRSHSEFGKSENLCKNHVDSREGSRISLNHFIKNLSGTSLPSHSTVLTVGCCYVRYEAAFFGFRFKNHNVNKYIIEEVLTILLKVYFNKKKHY